MDEQGHTSDLPFQEESAVLDKIVNWGVCGIAGLAVIVVAFLVIRQQSSPAAAPVAAPTQQQAQSGASPSPFSAASIEPTHPEVASTLPQATEPPPAIKRTRTTDRKPKEVDVPLVVEVHEHRKSSQGSDGGDSR